MPILVGTASWADKSFVDSGKFYPPDVTSPEERLRYYASQFPMVEVDSSYYAMPLPATTQQWAERTPDHFVFNVKASRLFTGHQAQLRVLPKDIQEALGRPIHENVYYRDLPEEIQKELWGRFLRALEPLHAAGKLGAIHFQFAPWITSGGDARQLVEHCVRVMEGTTMAVEFRNASWWNERNRESTLDGMQGGAALAGFGAAPNLREARRNACQRRPCGGRSRTVARMPRRAPARAIVGRCFGPRLLLGACPQCQTGPIPGTMVYAAGAIC